MHNMKIISTKDAAERLGISLRQIQTLIGQGKLPASKIGRDYAIDEKDLKLVETRRKGRPPKASSAKRGKAK